jgi:hypothetical protein
LSKVTPIHEVFKAASEIRIRKDRMQYLRDNASELMRYVVQGAYHPGVLWLLPKGVPNFKKAEPIGAENAFHMEFNRLYLFCKGGADSLKQYDRERLFINMLEKLHPEDALLLCNVKDKKINYPFLTYNMFYDSFPGWLPERTKEEAEEQ